MGVGCGNFSVDEDLDSVYVEPLTSTGVLEQDGVAAGDGDGLGDVEGFDLVVVGEVARFPFGGDACDSGVKRSEVDSESGESIGVGGESFDKVSEVLFGLCGPEDFGGGAPSWECHVFGVLGCAYVFGPDLELATDDVLSFFGLEGGGEDVEVVDFFEGEEASDGVGFVFGVSLIVVEVESVVGRHDYVVLGFGGGDTACLASPAHDGGSGGETAFEDFIPANEVPAFAGEIGVHLAHEPALHFVFVFESAFFDELLDSWACFPFIFGAFVAADVYVFAREDCHDLIEDVFEEFNGGEFGVEDVGVYAPVEGDIELFFGVPEFRVGGDGGL